MNFGICCSQTLGNHEFDNNVAGIVPFLKNVKSPVVVANIDSSEEPTMQVSCLTHRKQEFLLHKI